MGDAILMVNELSEIVFYNEAFCKMLGYEKDELVGGQLSKLLNFEEHKPDHADLVANFINKSVLPISLMSRAKYSLP